MEPNVTHVFMVGSFKKMALAEVSEILKMVL